MTILYTNHFESEINGATVAGWSGFGVGGGTPGAFLASSSSPIHGTKSYAMASAANQAAMLYTGISAAADLSVASWLNAGPKSTSRTSNASLLTEGRRRTGRCT